MERLARVAVAGGGSTLLAEALDTSAVVVTGGDEPWIRTWAPCYYGDTATESGDIDDDDESWMEATVYGTGSLSFYWMVSSQEDYDYLQFYIDDLLKDEISGETDWAQKQYNINTGGAHTLKWRYVKNSWGLDGDDLGWVDYLQWTGETELPESESEEWETITYVYDPAGRRIAKAIDGH